MAQDTIPMDDPAHAVASTSVFFSILQLRKQERQLVARNHKSRGLSPRAENMNHLLVLAPTVMQEV